MSAVPAFSRRVLPMVSASLLIGQYIRKVLLSIFHAFNVSNHY